ncbi:MAG: hypothetical protein PHN22_02765 [Candidatus ainarchaeum sp.]|nr:hypothetical protein [Candidatus ainarchaeum sp.]
MEEDLFGFDNAKRKELIMFLDAQNIENVNINSKFFKKVREELKDLVLFFEELKEEKESEKDAGL